MVEGIVFDSNLRDYVSTKSGRVILTTGIVVDILEVNQDGWNTGVIIHDLIEDLVGKSAPQYPIGQTILFHSSEVQ